MITYHALRVAHELEGRTHELLVVAVGDVLPRASISAAVISTHQCMNLQARGSCGGGATYVSKDVVEPASGREKGG